MWKEAAGVRDSLSFRGEIIVELFDRYRKLVNRLHSKNFIVDLGLETVIDILSGTVSGKIYRMAVNIVIWLKIVNIDHNQRNRRVGPIGTLPFNY